MGLMTCGVEFGPDGNRQKCTLDVGHPMVRNMYGHWAKPETYLEREKRLRKGEHNTHIEADEPIRNTSTGSSFTSFTEDTSSTSSTSSSDASFDDDSGGLE